MKNTTSSEVNDILKWIRHPNASNNILVLPKFENPSQAIQNIHVHTSYKRAAFTIYRSIIIHPFLITNLHIPTWHRHHTIEHHHGPGRPAVSIIHNNTIVLVPKLLVIHLHLEAVRGLVLLGRGDQPAAAQVVAVGLRVAGAFYGHSLIAGNGDFLGASWNRGKG